MNSTELYQFLPWDSDFFGYRIARYQESILSPEQWEKVQAWCKMEHIECLYFLADPNDMNTIRIAEDAGFRFVDIRLTLERGLDTWKSNPNQPDGVILRDWQEADLPELMNIARLSFTQTRFFFDPSFPPEKCAEMYAIWIDKSCHGRAQAVIVGEFEGTAAGFITCRLEPSHKTGEIELVGVSEHARGRGLGGALVSASLDWFINQGATSVQVVTQGRNLPAQRLYQRCNFTSQEIQLWYHKWFR